jgi:5'(3')-deoxyribonucleotidase
LSRDYTIGLDLDGCVYQWDKTARYMLRRRMEDRGEQPTDALYHASTSWDYIEENVSKEDWEWLWSSGTRQGLYRYGHVVSGAIEGVQGLANIGDVVVITARPKDAVNDTLTWLGTFFDKASLSGIVIQSNGQKKSQVEPVPDVYIDDGAHNLDDVLLNTDSLAIQFVQPWNAEYSPSLKALDRWHPALGWRNTVAVVEWAKRERP